MMEHPRFEDYDIVYRSPNRYEFMGNGFTLREVAGEDVAWYLDLDHIERPLFDH